MLDSPRKRIRRPRGDGGFATLELVVITPVLFAFILLIVGFGRVAHGRQLVQQAAAAAARAAALDDTPGQARTDARQEAANTLTEAGISCRSNTIDLDLSQFRPGGQVTARITCVVGLADLTAVGLPGAKTLTATATAPLEDNRQFGDNS